MQYIEAINSEPAKYKSIFLAGGISNCPDWQKDVANALKDYEITVFNPRRTNFPISIAEESQQQIKWEYQRLRQADFIVFWFSHATLNPITLFEYGSALERNQKLIVGVHPKYKRKQDVEIQTNLKNKGIEIVNSIPDLIASIKSLLD